MSITENLSTELKDEYNKCEELFNIAWKLNDNKYTRTAFTKMVTTYMPEVMQTIGFLYDKTNDLSNKNIDKEEIINELSYILEELDARNCSNNCIVSKLKNKSWIELCYEGIKLFEQLKK